jgi:ADP-heptose:LPS heptosyltransferase
MSSIRLISDDVHIHFSNLDHSALVKENNYIMRAPAGRLLTVCFASHLDSSKTIHPFVAQAIKNNVGVVYICEALPENPIIDDHVIYVECPYRWYIHTLFMNPLQFRAVFSDDHSERLARAFSEFTRYEIPRIKTDVELEKFLTKTDQDKDNILVEITGGVGDHLLTIPSLKTLASQGKKVFILCEKHRMECFANLDYISGIFTDRKHINVSKFEKILILHFGQVLNDYRSDLNKQNRIFAVAALCGIDRKDLVILKPEIIFTTDELNTARQKWGIYPNKLFFGFDSDRADAKMPEFLAQEKINAFKAKGFTVFTASLRKYNLQNCIDLTKQVSLRELFALMAVMDFVVTIDTSFLHIAGALEKKTFALMNYFDPTWRCSTYKNCHPMTPNVNCHPCVGRQFVPSHLWQCHNCSCYTHFNWEGLYKELVSFKLRLKQILKVPEEVKTITNSSIQIVPVNNEIQKHALLVYDNDGLGDVLMLTPSLEALYQRGYVVDVATRYPEAFANLPYVRQALSYKDSITDRKQYHRKIEISYKLSQYELAWCRQHRLLATAHLFGLKGEDLLRQRPHIILSEEEKFYVNKFFYNDKKVLCLGLTSADAKREYPREKRQELIDAIAANFPELQIVLVGDTAGDESWVIKNVGVKKELRYTNCLDLRGKTTIRELFSVVNRSDYCLSVDSAILHIAGGFTKPTIFLPSSIQADWRKYSETTVIVPSDSCYPCNERNCRCSSKAMSAQCMNKISCEKIVNTLKEIMK